MTTQEIMGFDVTPKLGSVIQPDQWKLSGRLIDGEIFGKKFSEFRLTTNNGIIESLPVLVEVTGRTLKYRHGERWVRVRITFLRDDDEPEETSGGFMFVPW